MKPNKPSKPAAPKSNSSTANISKSTAPSEKAQEQANPEPSNEVEAEVSAETTPITPLVSQESNAPAAMTQPSEPGDTKTPESDPEEKSEPLFEQTAEGVALNGKLCNGPTLSEYIAAGYKQENYPPIGYHAKPVQWPNNDADAANAACGDRFNVDWTYAPGVEIKPKATSFAKGYSLQPGKNFFGKEIVPAPIFQRKPNPFFPSLSKKG